MDSLARLRSIPPAPAPNDNPESIKGNVSLEEKRLQANILAYHVAHNPGSKIFANEALRGLQLVEVNVRKQSPQDASGRVELCAETICEITVEENMLNLHGTLSGGCAAHFLDICTFSSLFALGSAQGKDASGVSQTMNLIWHAPAFLGTRLRVISTSLAMNGRMFASRAEAYDKETSRLLISVVHTVTAVKPPPVVRKDSVKL